MKLDLDFLLSIAHSPIRNYVIPGLTSYLIGGSGPAGSKTRLFWNQRDHDEVIVPHSHRYAFQAVVLQGSVEHTIYKEQPLTGSPENSYAIREQILIVEPGGRKNYLFSDPSDPASYGKSTAVFRQGDSYGCSATDIHSIKFKRSTYVLMFEGPMTRDRSEVLLPVVDGCVVDTLVHQPWMFQRGAT